MNKIGYLTFGRDELSYGLALCMSNLSRDSLFRITPKTILLVDWVLFSVFWWEHIYLLANFLRAAGISRMNHPRPKIIIGGFSTFNPVPLSRYADFVICGDGEEALPAVLRGEEHPGIYYSPGSCATWQNIRALKAFCHETNGIARIELARGCKYRCRFCAVAHLKPYRETEIGGIEDLLRKSRSKRVSLFAPEPTLHSADEQITKICHRLGKIRVDSDVRLDHLSKRSDSVPRVGIEGLSEKLRKSVNKPCSNCQIIEATRQAITEGRKGFFVYLILDLPGESENDWKEFRELLREIGKLPGAENFLLKPSPSVFMPTPHTPMEFDAIHWETDYTSKWSSFFGRGNDRQWDVMIAERSRIFKPAMRILCMLATRAGAEFWEIEEELTREKIISVSGGRVHCKSERRLLSTLKNYGGVERYCGAYTGTPPWKSLQVGKFDSEIFREGGEK
jgi:hypothetical protein